MKRFFSLLLVHLLILHRSFTLAGQLSKYSSYSTHQKLDWYLQMPLHLANSHGKSSLQNLCCNLCYRSEKHLYGSFVCFRFLLWLNSLNSYSRLLIFHIVSFNAFHIHFQLYVLIFFLLPHFAGCFSNDENCDSECHSSGFDQNFCKCTRTTSISSKWNMRVNVYWTEFYRCFGSFQHSIDFVSLFFIRLHWSHKNSVRFCTIKQ